MTEDERDLWKRYGQRDEAARKALILFYLPLADVLAKRIARMAGWANWEDLRQDGVIGLIRAIDRFDPERGVPFKPFAKHFIQGAIFDSSELTRQMARRQEENYRKIKQAEDELTKTFERLPTLEEVAGKTGLTVEQINNALDAMSVAFARDLPDTESTAVPRLSQTPQPEATIMLREAISRLQEREALVIVAYYLEGQSAQEIGQRLGLTVSNVTKIRQRALKKLRERLDEKKKGGQDED